MKLSQRVQQLTPSTTLAITARAKELKKSGQDVVALGVGEPDFNTPHYILEAAKFAMDEGKTKYTPSGGIIELKDAIRIKFQKENSLAYRNDQIIVTVGAKQALYNVFQVLLNLGDEVIVPSPYWVSYIEQIKLAGGKPVIVSCDEAHDFKILPNQLEKAITNKTKAFLLNSPSNPTGMVYTEDELLQLGRMCRDHNLSIISDEIYEHLIYEGDGHTSIASLNEDLFHRTIVINGVSKTYSMTGWRIGYAAGPSNVIKAMTNIASHSTSNPTSISQHAALAALHGSMEDVNKMKKSFKERRDYIVNRINKIPLLSCKKPLGAFYVYVNIHNALEAGNYSSCTEWAERLLEQALVAVIPGKAFGSAGFIRLSYATSMDQLEKAMDRIEKFTLLHE